MSRFAQEHICYNTKRTYIMSPIKLCGVTHISNSLHIVYD